MKLQSAPKSHDNPVPAVSSQASQSVLTLDAQPSSMHGWTKLTRGPSRRSSVLCPGRLSTRELCRYSAILSDVLSVPRPSQHYQVSTLDGRDGRKSLNRAAEQQTTAKLKNLMSSFYTRLISSHGRIGKPAGVDIAGKSLTSIMTAVTLKTEPRLASLAQLWLGQTSAQIQRARQSERFCTGQRGYEAKPRIRTSLQ